MRILHVVGARPNFMKAAAVMRACHNHPQFTQVLVHTGQHYDANMSDVFFQDLEISQPDINLQVGSGSHAQQTAAIISRFEPVVLQHHPEMVLVYGDVNSTMACALVCAKLKVPIAHVEAGLRSFDRTMPEEINRLVTDQLSDLLFTPSKDGDENLRREGIPDTKIRLVGNVMIDTLVRLLPKARAHIPARLPPRYVLVTMHRPANVDDPCFLGEFLTSLCNIGDQMPVIFPVHPRTRQRIAELGFSQRNGFLHLMDPLSYLDFLALQTQAMVVVTDSGGIQEETTYLGIPCLTMRDNTERPITITMGTNVLIGRNPQRLREELERASHYSVNAPQRPPLWDGHAADRIANILLDQNADSES